MGDKPNKLSDIPGEATLYNLLPKGYTLISIIVAGAVYSAWAYSDILANAEDVQEVKKSQQEITPRVRILEQNQGVMQEQLKNVLQEQKRGYDKAREDKTEILNAIRNQPRND